jgi:toxin ParE1/3/4
MGAFFFTRKAKSDLKSIAAYTQRRWGKHQRRIYAKHFDETFHMLAETPNTGTSCNFIIKRYRKFPCSGQIIFYRCLEESMIEVVRIIHWRIDAHEKLRGI